MTTYRIHGEGLLALARMASQAPGADPDAILEIVQGAERLDADHAEEAVVAEPRLPDTAAGPELDLDAAPAKPE